jgi:hypothetical protein
MLEKNRPTADDALRIDGLPVTADAREELAGATIAAPAAAADVSDETLAITLNGIVDVLARGEDHWLRAGLANLLGILAHERGWGPSPRTANVEHTPAWLVCYRALREVANLPPAAHPVIARRHEPARAAADER